MDIFNKIKIIFKSKEARRDAVYAAATMAIIALTVGLFVWSVNIVLRAVDATFVIGGEEDISSEVLFFNLKGFAEVAPLLGIILNPVEKPVESLPATSPSVQIFVPQSETAATSTVASTTENTKPTSTPISIIE